MFKTLTLSLAALAATATLAAAESSYISNFVKEQNRDNLIELGTVRAAGNGVVEIFGYHKGKLGPLLGSESLHAGSNLDVEINVRRRPLTDVLAVLKVNGQIVDTQEIELN
ncbi:hypothetical protein [Pseudooctadecabacter jejudonensis]|uniref:Uncharacterized protein n=1 Tax=Pseudooctadecabacter jejudonensis TaxID=1391910 RepID=A0A1Y5THY1_9RHOB|nr:hypothetical protein [Pseudooctadecabacter jejudonensis]SLN64698.1 hypothetical protein PSJ8397_03400 [Pseudooctadecabacter jejudonensis]